jgi:dihydrodipicolinate synthase/N-acetylneuraminate lyase
MKRTHLHPEDFHGVIPVPPLARNNDAGRTINAAENDKLLRHIAAAGITRFIYGGNAFLYHLTLREYESLLDWMAGAGDDLLMIPSAGPSYGRLMDQAPLLRRYGFPCVMALPCGDPRDATGLERGLCEFAEASGCKLILYLKEENNFGADKMAGLDAVARMVAEGVCIAIKYAVVRMDPREDDYLQALLQRVDRKYVISGIGERPAVVHMRDWQLPAFTTGSGCIAPAGSQAIFESCRAGDYQVAERLRQDFIAVEDLRDAWGPARVLHAATELTNLANTGPTPPFISPLSVEQKSQLREPAAALAAKGAPSPRVQVSVSL